MVETTSPAIIVTNHTPASAFTSFTAKPIIAGKVSTIGGTPIHKTHEDGDESHEIGKAACGDHDL